MAREGFGSPKYGGATSFKVWDLKTDPKGGTVSYVFRIMPPMKSCAEKGEWRKYYGIHFGYSGIDSKDATKRRMRPFKCVEDKNLKTGMVRHSCPECDLIATKKAELESLLTALKADPDNTEQMIEDAVAEQKAWLKDHNVDRKWYMNVMTPQGEFGYLRMANDIKKLLEVEIETLRKEGIEPLDLDQGVWFRFTRTGAKIQAQTKITEEEDRVTDPATGRQMKMLRMAPLSDAQCEQALRECPDLNEVVRVISDEQIRLLTECSGDPAEVDEILAMGAKTEGSPKPIPPPRPAPVQQRAQVTPPKPTPAPAAKPAPAPAAPAAPEAAAVKAPSDRATVEATLKAMGLPDAVIQAALAAQFRAAPAPVVQKAEEPEPEEPAPDFDPEPPPPTPAPSTPAAAPGTGTPALPKDKFFQMFKK